MSSTKRETSRARLVSVQLRGFSRDEAVNVVMAAGAAMHSVDASSEARWAMGRVRGAVRREDPIPARNLGGMTQPEFAVFYTALVEAVRRFRGSGGVERAWKPFETKRIGTGPRSCECARCLLGMTESCERA